MDVSGTYKGSSGERQTVMEAYGFNWKSMTEADIVAELFKLYEKMTKVLNITYRNNSHSVQRL